MHKHRTLKTESCCRTVALSVLILSLSLSVLLLHHVTPTVLIGTLSAACGIMLVLPSAPPDKMPSCRGVFARGLAALLPVPLAAWLGENALPFLYTVVVAVFSAGIQTVSVLRTAGDRNFLSSDLPGWEVVLVYARQALAVYPAVMMALVWAVPDAGGPWERIVTWVAAASLSVLLTLFFLRSFTRMSLLADGFGSASEGDFGFFRPSAPFRLNVGQRMMFEKIRRYMEEDKPYLDDAYSLDDMARAMLTNKSMVSKVVNGYTGMNFPQFVNRYRIRYSMELFKKDPKLKINELFPMSGFHSGVSFNLAFKMFVGQTPSEWCRRCREQTDGSPLP